MDQNVPRFRELYEALECYEGSRPYDEVLMPWAPDARRALRALDQYRRMNSTDNPYEVTDEDLWQWYALGRVNDFLLMTFQARDDFYKAGPQPVADWLQQWEARRRRFLDTLQKAGPKLVASSFQEWEAHEVQDLLQLAQPGADFVPQCVRPPCWWMSGIDVSPWDRATVSAAQYQEFFVALGFTPITDRPFSPFHHEIVEVVEIPDLPEEVMVDHVYWPGLMFGEMLFSRSGVRVRCRRGVLDKSAAEDSILFFTFARHRRKTEDLSHGWGHNSQWTTRFRRDYETERYLHYNVDGRPAHWREAEPATGSSPPADQFADFRIEGEFPPGNRYKIYCHDYKIDSSENYILDYNMTIRERIELLTYRCLVSRANKDELNLNPYYDRYTAKK